MSFEDPGFTDNALFALDADYEKLATFMHDTKAKAMLAYIKHIRKAHEDGVAAMRELGATPYEQNVNMIAVFGALAAQAIEDSDQRRMEKVLTATDLTEFFGGCIANRFKSLWSCKNV